VDQFRAVLIAVGAICDEQLDPGFHGRLLAAFLARR